ncbi:unnamed protein product [Knipowitschia caucasica]|uniref:Uncharacterized protein n=1 Tax=Knipowitschia caucasica TaxID=637954 RepID=A0AAV2LKM9_KNICA
MCHKNLRKGTDPLNLFTSSHDITSELPAGNHKPVLYGVNDITHMFSILYPRPHKNRMGMKKQRMKG